MMQLGRGAVLVGCLFLAWGAGCSKRVDASGEGGLEAKYPAGEYYPLAVGNEWTYQVQMLGQKGEMNVRIDGEEGGYFHDSRGEKLKRDTFGIRDDKRYLIRDPLRVGQTWTNVVSVSSVEHYRVIGVGETCRTDSATFEDCVRIESRNRGERNTTLVNEFTFAPRVGIVRIQVVAEREGEKIPQTDLALKTYKVR